MAAKMDELRMHLFPDGQQTHQHQHHPARYQYDNHARGGGPPAQSQENKEGDREAEILRLLAKKTSELERVRENHIAMIEDRERKVQQQIQEVVQRNETLEWEYDRLNAQAKHLTTTVQQVVQERKKLEHLLAEAGRKRMRARTAAITSSTPGADRGGSPAWIAGARAGGEDAEARPLGGSGAVRDVGEMALGDGRVANGRAGDGRAGDGRIGDGRIGDGRIGDGRAGDGRIGDGRMGDGRIGDGRIGDGRAGDGNVRGDFGQGGNVRQGVSKGGNDWGGARRDQEWGGAINGGARRLWEGMESGDE